MKRIVYTIIILLVTVTLDAADDITIIGDQVRDIEKIERSTGSVEIINLNDVHGKATSVAEVLADSAGIQVKRFGSMGSQSHISIRGSNPNQVMIYVDGVALNDSVFGEVNIEDIPLANVERIEIYRGFTPLRFGLTGIGGVVNIVTKKAAVTKQEANAKNKVQLSYGSFNTIKTSLSRYQKIDDFHYALFFDRTSSDGDFKFKDDNGTPVYNTADDRVVKRKNNDHVAYSANLKCGYDFETVRLLLANDFYSKDHGIAGINNNDALQARFNTRRDLLTLNAAVPKLFFKNVQADFKAFYSYRRDRFDDPGDEIGLGVKQQLGFFDAYGGSMFMEIAAPVLWQTFSVLASTQQELYHSENSGFSDDAAAFSRGPTQKRNKINLGIEDEISLFDDRLQIVPTIRYDTWNDDFYIENNPFLDSDAAQNSRRDSAISWKVGARLNLYKHNKQYVRLKGNISRDYRVPTFTELFGDRGTVLGNPELKPEKALNRDVGCELSFLDIAFLKKLQFSYSYFDNTIENIILFIHNSQNTMIAHNISAARISGHEFILNALLTRYVIVKANYTYQLPIDKSDIPYYRNNYLPHRPLHEASLSLKGKLKYAALAYNLNYMGANFRDRANSEFYFVDKRTYHDIILEVFPLSGLVITLEAKNILNDMTRDRVGYPLPGRSFYATTGYTF